MEDSGFDSDQKPVQTNGTNSHAVSSLKHMSDETQVATNLYHVVIQLQCTWAISVGSTELGDHNNPNPKPNPNPNP